MNGEIEQMSNIVISARKALYEDNSIDFCDDSIRTIHTGTRYGGGGQYDSR